jgi:hypothetical protein
MTTPGERANGSDSAAAGDGPLEWLDARLAAVRADDRRRRVALAGALLLGLAAATIHWWGLVVGGALVGLTRRTVPRALLAGFGFGILVLALFLVVTPATSVDALATLRPLSFLTVGVALVAPVWGALLRAAI